MNSKISATWLQLINTSAVQRNFQNTQDVFHFSPAQSLHSVFSQWSANGSEQTSHTITYAYPQPLSSLLWNPAEPFVMPKQVHRTFTLASNNSRCWLNHCFFGALNIISIAASSLAFKHGQCWSINTKAAAWPSSNLYHNVTPHNVPTQMLSRLQIVQYNWELWHHWLKRINIHRKYLYLISAISMSFVIQSHSML